MTALMNSADVTARLARNVKRTRANNDWTQDQLAEQLGVTRNVISMWEQGTRRIGERHLLDLVEISGNDIAWFYADDPALA